MMRITGTDSISGKAAEAAYMQANRWIGCTVTPGCDGIGPIWQACQCGAMLLPPNTAPTQINLPTWS